jgi:hypothetical protein
VKNKHILTRYATNNGLVTVVHCFGRGALLDDRPLIILLLSPGDAFSLFVFVFDNSKYSKRELDAQRSHPILPTTSA